MEGIRCIVPASYAKCFQADAEGLLADRRGASMCCGAALVELRVVWQLYTDIYNKGEISPAFSCLKCGKYFLDTESKCSIPSGWLKAFT